MVSVSRAASRISAVKLTLAKILSATMRTVVLDCIWVVVKEDAASQTICTVLRIKTYLEASLLLPRANLWFKPIQWYAHLPLPAAREPM